MSSDQYDLIPIEGVYKANTEKAVCINIKGEDIWFPLSQVETPDLDEFERGAEIEIDVPRWLCEEKEVG